MQISSRASCLPRPTPCYVAPSRRRSRHQPVTRARLFEQLVRDIESYMAAHPEERPWTGTVYTGTDGSRIFRGGVGHSLVFDRDGRLWRARSYEDFETTYTFSEGSARLARSRRYSSRCVSTSPGHWRMRIAEGVVVIRSQTGNSQPSSKSHRPRGAARPPERRLARVS